MNGLCSNKIQRSLSLSEQTHVLSVGMSRAQTHRQNMLIDAEVLNEFRQLSGVERNERGPSTDPCGTPHIRGVSTDKECRTRICWDLQDK